MEENRDPIMRILSSSMREGGYTLMRKIGTWKEERGGGCDFGFYLEAVEIAPEKPRYLQASTSLMDEENETKPLDEGFEVWIKINREEFTQRIA
jgi:hypothetical protein